MSPSFVPPSTLHLPAQGERIRADHRLLYPDKEEIESVLEGRNHATLVITERERERAKLRGEAYEDELDGKLSVFGLNEAALFEWLETDQWKESRYERLVTREMPD